VLDRKKMMGNLSVCEEIRILKALKFSGGKLRTYSTGFLSYDLPEGDIDFL